MKTSSKKAKGRNLQNFIADQLTFKYYPVQTTPDGKPCLLNVLFPEMGWMLSEFRPAIMGEGGVDIKMGKDAKEKFPFDIECKNQENWSIPAWWKQTTANTENGRKPLLVIKKNRHEPLVVLRWSDFKEML